MEVQCEICNAEYDFDDALVTTRGTTVRCTQCGHQFKVTRGVPTEGVDEWVVLTSGGDELRFRSLRDLQRAILERRVSRADLFVVGAGEPRALGSVVELEPFFEGRISSRPPPPPRRGAPISLPRGSATPSFASRTGDGSKGDETEVGDEIGGQPEQKGLVEERSASVFETETSKLPGDLPSGPGGERRSPPPSHPFPATPPDSSAVGPVTPRKRMETLRPPDSAGGVPPPPSSSLTHDLVSAPDTPHHAAQSAQAGWVPTQITSLPVPSHRSRHPSPAPVSVASHPPPRGEVPSIGEDYVRTFRRRRVGGWIVAFTLLVALTVVGWGAVRPYLGRPSVVVVAVPDLRVAGLLGDGERALMEGDIDGAEEAFGKASALAENDAHVLRDRSRLAAIKADIPWLALKLLPPNAMSELHTASAQLESSVVRAKRAASQAYGLAPDDPANVCALIDALRLEGNAAAARALVSKVIARAGERDLAYVLAALDLTEADPMWSTVVERLRVSAASDVQAGRARAALVYALGRSGDRAGAATELGKLDVAKRPYPLLPTLHKWLEALGSSPAGSASHSPARRTAGPTSSVTAPQAGTDVAASEGTSLDAGAAMQTAAAALRSGAYARAEQLYRMLVARNGRDSEALAGLGDVAHAQGDVRGAMAAYRRAISVNPSYLPALVGLADAEWAAGDRAQAQRAYASVVDHFPEGSYPVHVRERSEAQPAIAPSANESASEFRPLEEDHQGTPTPSSVDDDR